MEGKTPDNTSHNTARESYPMPEASIVVWSNTSNPVLILDYELTWGGNANMHGLAALCLDKQQHGWVPCEVFPDRASTFTVVKSHQEEIEKILAGIHNITVVSSFRFPHQDASMFETTYFLDMPWECHADNGCHQVTTIWEYDGQRYTSRSNMVIKIKQLENYVSRQLITSMQWKTYTSNVAEVLFKSDSPVIIKYQLLPSGWWELVGTAKDREI